VDHICSLCGSTDIVLVYPANTSGDVSPSEFACTSNAVALHDDIVQCRRCGMVTSKPTLDRQSIIEKYSQMIDESYLFEQEARKELFDWVLDRIESFLAPGQDLLEVGSNVGLFLKTASDRGWKARGVEPSRWAVQVGVQRFGVNLTQGTLDEVDVTAGKTDVAVMLDVLEHLSDPVADLRKLRDLMHEQGLLALSTIDLSSLHAKVRDGHWPWFIRPHLHYFTPESLRATLERSGFRMVLWAVVPRSFHLSYLARRAGSSIGPVGKVAERVATIVDPRLPMGWLGDVIFTVARPIPGWSSSHEGAVPEFGSAEG
jgi:2-polyprenyl-3-methyl-5-hydroxy-6-metoxy-1,4-benzoquinol methylase